jgi:hypothetical protein
LIKKIFSEEKIEKFHEKREFKCLENEKQSNDKASSTAKGLATFFEEKLILRNSFLHFF